MARYIDADAFLDKFNKALESQQHYGFYNQAKITQYVMKAIENEPTADVVPKSEYDEVLSNWQKIHDSYNSDCIEHYKYGRAEVAREIFEEIEQWLGNYNGCRVITYEKFDELKKKYTEDKK